MKKFKQVTREEFKYFVESYPSKLVYDVCGISEPPTGTYNDFSIGKYPQSVVARISLMDGSSFYNFRKDEHFILDDEAKP